MAGIFAVVACYAIFYLCTAFALGYATTTAGHPRETVLGVQLVAILFLAAGIVLAGYLSDRFDPRRVLMAGCLPAVLCRAAAAGRARRILCSRSARS